MLVASPCFMQCMNSGPCASNLAPRHTTGPLQLVLYAVQEASSLIRGCSQLASSDAVYSMAFRLTESYPDLLLPHTRLAPFSALPFVLTTPHLSGARHGRVIEARCLHARMFVSAGYTSVSCEHVNGPLARAREQDMPDMRMRSSTRRAHSMAKGRGARRSA